MKESLMHDKMPWCHFFKTFWKGLLLRTNATYFWIFLSVNLWQLLDFLFVFSEHVKKLLWRHEQCLLEWMLVLMQKNHLDTGKTKANEV